MSSPAPTDYRDALERVGRADPGATLGADVRIALGVLVSGAPRERSDAVRALRGFITARARGRRVRIDAMADVVSDIEFKLFERPELFRQAADPAAYLSTAVRNRWLSQLRKEQRDARRVPDPPAPPPSKRAVDVDEDALLVRARADLSEVAELVTGAAPAEVREQQAQTWSELWALFERSTTMNALLARGLEADPEMQRLHSIDEARALKTVRDRLLQRHHRMRKRIAAALDDLESDATRPDWTRERSSVARIALRQLLVRCKHPERRPPTSTLTEDGDA